MKVKLSGIRKIAVTSEYIKLDSLLKLSSIAATGGEAKLIIAEGGVFVNGEICTTRGKKIRSGDVVRCGKETLVVDRRGDL